MKAMEEIKQPAQAFQVISTEDPDETVLLRRDSSKLRANRRQNRERTPTALVSRAFDFLNEDLHSSVTVFEHGSLNVPSMASDISQEDQYDGNLNGDQDLQYRVFVRDCKSKDSGFASLERCSDQDTIEPTISELRCENNVAQVSHEIDHIEIESQSQLVCNVNSHEGNVHEKQVVEGDIVSKVHTRSVPNEQEVGTFSSISEEEQGNKDYKSNISVGKENTPDLDSVRGIKETVALAMNVLGGDSDDELGDEYQYHPSAVVDECNADNHIEEVSHIEQCLSTQNIIYDDINHGHEAGMENHSNDLALSHQSSQKEMQSVLDNSATDGRKRGENIPVKDTLVEKDTCDIKSNTIRVSLDAVENDTCDIKSNTTRVSLDAETAEQILPGECSEISIKEESHMASEDLKAESKRREEAPTDDDGSEKTSCESETKIIKIERNNQDNAASDDSSDEDTGIYAESFRRSNWIRVSKDGKLQLDVPTATPPPESSTSLAKQNTTASANVNDNDNTDSADQLSASVLPESDDVFDQTESPSQNWMHKRSDSLASTASECEFKRKYVSRRKCLVQRADSQQEYHRLSARIYEQDKEVIIERDEGCQDLGIHLLDSHPAFITSVDPGSPADKAGIVEGQILVSVNDLSVLTTSHDDIIDLIQKCEGTISLGVANSDFQPVRDLQTPAIAGYLFKLGHSSLMRTWKKRYFILRHDNCLYYYKNEQESDPLGALPLNGYTISRHTETNKDYCFKAEKYGARAYYFMTDNRDQMTEWVGAMTQAAVRSKKRKESFMSVSSHNVSLPALDIRRPECSGYLNKMVNRSINRRYCVLKDACIYYYKDVNSLSAQGVAHLHGYTIDVAGHSKKKNSFSLHPPEQKMRAFYFSADNDTDKKRWVESLIHSIQRWVKVDS